MKKRRKEEMVQPSLLLNKDLIQSVLNFLLEQNFSFVAFQFPFTNEFQILVQNSKNGNKSFHFESFDSLSISTIKGDLYHLNNLGDILKLENKEVLKIKNQVKGFYMSSSEYQQYVTDIIQQIEAGTFTKCVAARKIKIDKTSDFSVSQSFINMLSQYDGAFRYLANTNLGLWMGATPELLLEKNSKQFSTVALAGTKTDNRAWTNKEKDEQAIVTQYIIDTLKENNAQQIETSETYTFNAGHLQHLKTDIKFHSDKLLANKLHPTPAVCGLPLLESKEYILAKEQKNRSLYSGYLGLNGHYAKYYVNLRCLQMFDNHIDIYVGAGITATSIPQNEWLETENKAKIMLNILT